MKQIIKLKEKTIQKLKIYEDLLKKWQGKINLIAPSTINDVWKRHILDSAQLYSLLPANKNVVVLDMGSGAGFPGLVLAIINQTQGSGLCQFHLVESDARKCAFMQEIARLTQIQIKIHNCRVEELEPFKADIITARALKELKTLLDFSYPFLKEETICLFLKGENAELELKWATNNYSFLLEKIPSLTEKSFILKITEIHK